MTSDDFEDDPSSDDSVVVEDDAVEDDAIEDDAIEDDADEDDADGDGDEGMASEVMSGADDARAEASSLYGRLRELAEGRDKTAEWFQMWLPAALAAQKLAMTLFTLARHFTNLARSEEELDPIPEELRDELKLQFSALQSSFPDAADIIFGFDHIDRLIDAAMADETARQRAVKLGRVVTEMADALIAGFIDVAMRPGALGFSADRLTEYLEKLEAVLQKLLDRWVFPMITKSLDDRHD